jgi:PAS domain S-box-containing protein
MNGSLGRLWPMIRRAWARVSHVESRHGGPGPEILDRGTAQLRAIRENSARYLAIMDTTVHAIIVVDRVGSVQSFNRSAERIFGYSTEEVVGRDVRMLVPGPDQFRDDGLPTSDLKTGKRTIGAIGREVLGLRQDGTTVPLELSIAGWRDVDGEQCFIWTMHDLTPRNQRARELQRATEVADQARMEAEAANRAKTEFLAVMSHEIRTPLTSINGFTDLLSRSGRLTQKQRRYLDLIRMSNVALQTVVNDILDFSKVEAGQLELEQRPFSPARLVHDTIIILRPIAANKALPLKYSLERGVPEWVIGDDARLRQVLLNLLNNAVKFTETGSIAVTVRPLVGENGDERIYFAVTDTGIGIPIEQQHRLFKQFSQADGSVSRQHGGTGLGLAISKRLVELMGGEIGVVSEVGKGTTLWFTVRLPAAAAPAAVPESDSTPTFFLTSKARILLVDDLETNQEIVRAYLEDGGYEVVTVSSGEEALSCLREEPIDLVLMDIQMPVMDGVAATRAIRAMEAPLKDIPVIAMTGNVLPQQVQSFLQAGMNDHVGKPIERSNLYTKLWRWLPSNVLGAHSVPEGSVVNQAKLEELINALGPVKVESTLLKFAEQLRGSFNGSLPEARREAHDLINSAGLLGFETLLELVRTLKDTPGDGEEALGLLAQCRLARDAVLELVTAQVLPGLGGPVLRKAG